jgi:hypothetical protein
LKRWNDLNKPNVLKPGQRLTLYVDVSKTSWIIFTNKHFASAAHNGNLAQHS